MPKLSVIIPVYNVADYLDVCLESLLNQSLPDIEFICINDGSTDDSLDILNKYAKNDSRIKVYTQENLGPGIARNRGIKIASGEYIAFVDPDDWVEKDAFMQLYNFAVQQNAQVVQFDYIEHNEKLGIVKEYNFADFLLKRFKFDIRSNVYYTWRDLKDGCLRYTDMHVWRRIYRKEFVDKYNISFAPTRHGEDHLFVNAVTLNAEKIFYLEKYLYHYRRRENSLVDIKTEENFCIFQNIDTLKSYLIQNNLMEDIEEEFQKYKLQTMLWHFPQIPEKDIDKYKNICKSYLSAAEYKKFLLSTRAKNSFWENIFSIKNCHASETKTKIITILWIKFKIKMKNKK